VTSEFTALLPLTKFETERAAHLASIGYPQVESVMPQILEWLQDPNWPVARIFLPFAASIGAPLAPHVRPILQTDDGCWKHSVLSGVVANSLELASCLRPELERLARSPSPSELREEIDVLASEILDRLDQGPEA
jgi:hypothetical protein